MPIIEIAKIQVRRGQENQTGMPQLDPGELGWAEDTQRLYIGKRIAEGAVDDNNSRILTEQDLKTLNIFSLMPDGSSIASTSSYRYQEGIANAIKSSTSTIATKLDTWVSLTDFAETKWSFTATTEISTVLQKALGLQTNPSGVIENNISGSISGSVWAPRSIKIPAGYYTVSSPIDLPPNTKLVGDGPGRTVITALGGGIFRTVDSTGTNFVGMSNPAWNGTFEVQPKNIHLEGMTLKGIGTSTLVSLDNVNGVNLIDLQFGDMTVATTSTIIGVGIRDTSDAAPGSVELAYSANINIDNCKFNGLDKGVYQSVGSTNVFTVRNSDFTYMNRAIEVWNTDVNLAGPVNGNIENNTFDYIYKEALYIGTATNTTTNAFVISTNNTYRDVGNDSAGDYNSNGHVTSVINFNNLNNRSVNDYFGRFSSPVNPSYNLPVVKGHAYIENTVSYSKVVGASTTTEYHVASFALNEYNQLVTVNYTLIDVANTITSRTGNLTMNIVGTSNNQESFASVSDYYNFADVLPGASNFVEFSTDHTSTTATNIVSLSCWNFLSQYYDPTTNVVSPHLTNLDFKYQFNILQ